MLEDLISSFLYVFEAIQYTREIHVVSDDLSVMHVLQDIVPNESISMLTSSERLV